MRQTACYRADDGCLFETPEEAAAHEVQELLEKHSDDGMVSTRVLAHRLTEPALRNQLTKILSQLK